MNDDFGIRLTLEDVSTVLQRRAQRPKVLDDAVVNHCQASRPVGERVRVGARHTAVGGPPRVAKAYRRIRKVKSSIPDFPNALVNLDMTVYADADAPRVISAV